MANANIPNHELLSAALAGYQHQLEGIHVRMAEILSALGGKALATTKPVRKIIADGSRPDGQLLFHHQPDEILKPSSKVEAAYYKADHAIQRVLTLLAA